MKKFCIYLTTYSGNKMPKYYLGSTNLDRIKKGYRGSVLSKKWKSIWKQELETNPNLFKTEILETFNTREEALAKEKHLQIENKVVTSSEWINESLAIPNGFFGRDVSGENNPMYGKGHKIKEAWESGKFKNVSEKCSKSATKQWSDPNIREQMIKNMRKPRSEKICPNCGLKGRGGNMTRYHFDNCKEKA